MFDDRKFASFSRVKEQRAKARTLVLVVSRRIDQFTLGERVK
jgi:hypothetical protein